MQVTFIRIYFVSFFLLCAGKSTKKIDCDHLITSESEWSLQFDSSSDSYSFMKTRDLSVTQVSYSEKNVKSYFRNLPSLVDPEAKETGDVQGVRLCVLSPPKQRIVLKIPQSGNWSHFNNESISDDCFYPRISAWQSTSTNLKMAPLDRNTRHLSSRKKISRSRESRQLCRKAASRQIYKQFCSKYKKRRRLKQDGRSNSSLPASRRHDDVKNNELSPKERSIGNPSERFSDKKSIANSKPPLTSNVHNQVIKTHKKSRKKRQVDRTKKNNWLRIFQFCTNSTRGHSQQNSYFNVQNVANWPPERSIDGNRTSSQVKSTHVRVRSTNVVINTSSSVLFMELKWIVKSQLPALDLHFRFKDTAEIIADAFSRNDEVDLSSSRFLGTSTSVPQRQPTLPHPTTNSVPSLQNTTDVTITHNPVKSDSNSSLVIVVSLATLLFMTIFSLTCCIWLWLRKRSSDRRMSACAVFQGGLSSQVRGVNIHEQITEPGGKYCCEKSILKSHHHATGNDKLLQSHLAGDIERCYRPHGRQKEKNKPRRFGCFKTDSLDPTSGSTPFMLYPSHNRKPPGAKGLMHNNISTTQLTYSRPQNNPYTAESLSLKTPKCPSSSTMSSRYTRSDDVTLYVTKKSKPSSRMGYHDARPVINSCVRAPPNRTVPHCSALDNLSRAGNTQNSTTPFHSVTPASSEPTERGEVLTCPPRRSNNPSSSNNSNEIDMFFPAAESPEEILPPEYSSPPEYNSLSPDFNPT